MVGDTPDLCDHGSTQRRSPLRGGIPVALGVVLLAALLGCATVQDSPTYPEPYTWQRAQATVYSVLSSMKRVTNVEVTDEAIAFTELAEGRVRIPLTEMKRVSVVVRRERSSRRRPSVEGGYRVLVVLEGGRELRLPWAARDQVEVLADALARLMDPKPHPYLKEPDLPPVRPTPPRRASAASEREVDRQLDLALRAESSQPASGEARDDGELPPRRRPRGVSNDPKQAPSLALRLSVSYAYIEMVGGDASGRTNLSLSPSLAQFIPSGARRVDGLDDENREGVVLDGQLLVCDRVSIRLGYWGAEFGEDRPFRQDDWTGLQKITMQLHVADVSAGLKANLSEELEMGVFLGARHLEWRTRRGITAAITTSIPRRAFSYGEIKDQPWDLRATIPQLGGELVWQPWAALPFRLSARAQGGYSKAGDQEASSVGVRAGVSFLAWDTLGVQIGYWFEHINVRDGARHARGAFHAPQLGVTLRI